MIRLDYASPMAVDALRQPATHAVFDALRNLPVHGTVRLTWYRPERRWVAAVHVAGEQIEARERSLAEALRTLIEQVTA